MSDIFLEITVALVAATVLGMVAQYLRQPTILGYIATGLLVGPLGLLHLNNAEVLDAMAQIGITLLLFLVGIDMRLRDLKTLGRTAFIVGTGQIILTAVFGYLIVAALGFRPITALYVAIALTFSSTIIAVKLLAEKNVLDSMYGRIVVSILLVQDFAAMIMLVLVTGIAGSADGAGAISSAVLVTLVKAFVLFGVAMALGKYFIPKLLHFASRSQEILFLTSLAWGLGLAALVTIPPIGFSIEMGGFLAGIAMAGSVQHFQISSRIKPLRDFFVVMFFIVLGSRMILSNLSEIWPAALILSAFILIGTPVIVMSLMGWLGYRARTSFMTSVALAQISEFSLILATLGHRVGYLDDKSVALITAVGIITITLSSYMIIYDEKLYHLLQPLLKWFEFGAGTAEKKAVKHGGSNHIVLVGCHRMGLNVLRSLEALHKEFIVVDFNPEIIEELHHRNIKAVFGDISDPEIQEATSIDRARLVISTAPNYEDSISLLQYVKQKNTKTKVILTSQTEAEAERLYGEGADYVLLPHFIGGLQLAHTIRTDRSLRSLAKMRRQDLGIIGKHA